MARGVELETFYAEFCTSDCHRPRHLGSRGDFNQFVFMLPRGKQRKTKCHHCNRRLNHRLSLEMMEESIRPHPNLDRFYSACVDFAMEWYRDLSTKPLGEQIVPVSARPAVLDSMEKVRHFAYFFLKSVRTIANLEQSEIYPNLQEWLRADQDEALQDIAQFVP